METKKESYFNVAPSVWGMKIVFVNIFMVAVEGNRSHTWVLIDAGLKGSAKKIIRMANELFGSGTKPSAILLTHGHFDHVGALEELLNAWEVPVYSHPLELPYLRGLSSYPPPDPMTGGGLMSVMSWMFPRRPKDLGHRIRPLPPDHTVPALPGWTYVHTPGHAPGQVAFFREADRTLIAGDTFVTTRQESVFAVMTQKQILSGPPRYFTTDWKAAKLSIEKLFKLAPECAATGHGYPMYGAELRKGIDHLLMHFEEEAVPAFGRYVKEPAIVNEHGVQYIPQKQ